MQIKRYLFWKKYNAKKISNRYNFLTINKQLLIRDNFFYGFCIEIVTIYLDSRLLILAANSNSVIIKKSFVRNAQ